jgi:hypothetical protein
MDIAVCCGETSSVLTQMNRHDVCHTGVIRIVLLVISYSSDSFMRS